MLNPSILVDALAARLTSLPKFAAAMTVGEEVRIRAFHYRLGSENRLAGAVANMEAPSALVAWEGTMPGRADGSELFKHRFCVYLRMGNSAGVDNPVGYEDLWWLICNEIPSGEPVNLRYLNISPGLEIMDTPSIVHQLDDDLMDLFRCVIVIPEIGDN